MSPTAKEYKRQERAEWENKTEANPRSGCHRAAAIPQECANDDTDDSEEKADDEWQLNQCKRSSSEGRMAFCVHTCEAA